MDDKTVQAPEGEILLIDKSFRWTSFDVVKKLRNLLKIKKIGHAGTLDPLATGLLIICTGKKTKQISGFVDMEKEYTGTMVMGKTTPSFDLETAIDRECSIDHLDEAMINETAQRFVGEIWQKPPIYSAIKVNGDRLYKKARKGQEAKIEPRKVKVFEFEITKINLPDIHFRLVCSKGFYVRSLANDFGEVLGVGAHLSALRRTRIGKFHVENAYTLEALQDKLTPSGQ